MSEEGPTAETEVERLDREIEALQIGLAQKGYPIENYGVSGFKLECRIKVLEQLLVDKGIITQEEAELMIREKAIESLKIIEGVVDNHIKEMRAQQIYLPIDDSRTGVIFGANGQPLR